MVRLAVTLAFIAIFTVSASVVLDAQRGGGGARGGGGGTPGGRMQGGGGGGMRGGGGGFRFQGRVNMPPALPSINRPSFPIDGFNRPAFPLSGPLGFGPALRSPFDARRGTFTRIHPFNSFGVPFGYGSGAVYGPSYEPESTYDKM